MIFNTTHDLGNIVKGKWLGCRNQASAQSFCTCRCGNWTMWYLHLQAPWFSVPCTSWGPCPQFFISCSRMIYVTLAPSGLCLLYCSLVDPFYSPPGGPGWWISHQATSHVFSLFLTSFYRTSGLFWMLHFPFQRTFYTFPSVSLSFDSPLSPETFWFGLGNKELSLISGSQGWQPAWRKRWRALDLDRTASHVSSQ